MSEPKRDERVALRELPPVAPVRWPERLSMTLARHLNRCPRAAYLYVATGGSAPTLEMDRGTLTHAALARMMVEWMAPDAEERYGGAHDEELSSMTAELVRDVGRQNPHLWVSHEQRDIARLCVFHAAIGLDVRPDDVVGIERKFVLELDCGWTISGIVDLASMPEGQEWGGQVDDYKTSFMPQGEWDSFQTKMYAAMLVFGRPVEREACDVCGGGGVRREIEGAPPCDRCRGRGYLEVVAEKPVGGHLQKVRGRELYPRHDPRKRLKTDLAYNERTWTRLELQELILDMEDTGERLSEMLETWKFPARYGTKACNECPAEALCPIPRGYRRFAGHVQTLEQAREAWSWAQRMKGLTSITEKEVREFAAVNAVAIEVGDEVWEHTLTEQRKLRQAGGRSDWDGLQAAIEAAIEEGAPFKIEDWIRTSNVPGFKKRRVSSGTAAPAPKRKEVKEDAESAERRRDEQFGDTLPE